MNRSKILSPVFTCAHKLAIEVSPAQNSLLKPACCLTHTILSRANVFVNSYVNYSIIG